MTHDAWISVKEAAALYGLNAEYFRQRFCNAKGVLECMGGLRIRKGPTGRRRILVLQSAVTQLIEDEKGLPA